MTTPIEDDINSIRLMLEFHDLHLAATDSSLEITDQTIAFHRERLELLSKRITALEKRLEIMEKKALEHGEHIKKLANLITRLASHGLEIQTELKEIRNEQK